jgi:release factor glutamine methyltransferase
METPGAPASDDVWTVQKILQWTAGFLKGRGIESSRLESELLLATVRKCARIRLYTDFEAVVTGPERIQMREMVKRRARREPLSYIIGEREFYGRTFEVGPGVLIPRPETEMLIDVALEHIAVDDSCLIADIGFGSGCIATTIALQRPTSAVVGTDLSDAAMDYATRNISRHEVEDRVTLFQGDLMQPLAQTAIGQLDGIVSNPPYIRDSDMAALQPEVAEYEPREALIGGLDGLDVVRKLIVDSRDCIRPGGFIVLEIDPPQADEVCQLLQANGFQQWRVRQDLDRHDRVVQAIRL